MKENDSSGTKLYKLIIQTLFNMFI
jgi:hypothetical protein